MLHWCPCFRRFTKVPWGVYFIIPRLFLVNCTLSSIVCESQGCRGLYFIPYLFGINPTWYTCNSKICIQFHVQWLWRYYYFYKHASPSTLRTLYIVLRRFIGAKLAKHICSIFWSRYYLYADSQTQYITLNCKNQEQRLHLNLLLHEFHTTER